MLSFVFRVVDVALTTAFHVLRLAAVLAFLGWPLVVLVATANHAGTVARAAANMKAAILVSR
ncbi:hypothetical protein CHU95_03555 [Niveispirillum lacus]|uniref:Uncharacterized protein n=2 Tax=Niveispirillum lacus TaxID=1981099 RepID=A0A255Z5P5_9PROT|nr:hypothetical protein CHU95_03555 [Niveispirillum lacus]